MRPGMSSGDSRDQHEKSKRLSLSPYCARQRWNVASLTSMLYNTAASSLSAFSIASTSRSFRTICSGVCRFLCFVVIESLLLASKAG